MSELPEGPGRIPGDLLMHPAALTALALVIVNDRVLKVHTPSWFTGKLSDFAGLVYFPLFVVSVAEAVRWIVTRRRWALRPRSVIAVSVAVGIALVLIKSWGPAAEFYRSNLGIALWPVYLVGDLAHGRSPLQVRRAGLVEDTSDLVALVALALPVWVAFRVMRHDPTPSA